MPCLSSNEQKIRAFIVGINGYKFRRELKNAVPDARAMRDLLQSQGAEVFYGENLSIKEFRALEKQYEEALQEGDIGFVHFAGHANVYRNHPRLLAIRSNEADKIREHSISLYKLNIRSCTKP